MSRLVNTYSIVTMNGYSRSAVLAFGLFAAVAVAASPQDSLSRLRGANYVPSYARNDVQTWMDYDPTVVDRELEYAAKLKLNCVRVFLNVAVYERGPQRFLDRFENLLVLCDKNQIKLMPVLFDSCFDPQAVDLEDYRNKNWMPSPGFSRLGVIDHPAMEDYIHAVVGKHKDDRRILIWDVMNEPESTAKYQDLEQGGRQTINEFVRWSLRRVRKEKPVQPLTIGWATPDSNIATINLVDVICLHLYCPYEDLKSKILEAKEWGRLYGKPVIMNEFIGRPVQSFEQALPIVRQCNLGWVFWELMIGRTQFTEGAYPYQGLVYPDGTCLDAGEVASVANVSPEEARRLFPERPVVEIKDNGASYRGHWTRWTGPGPLKDRLFCTKDPKSMATFEFNGNTVTLIHKVGPDCGIAQALIDGKPAAPVEFDTYSPTVQWNHHTVVATNLPLGQHIIVIVPSGKKNGKSADTFIQIVDFE